MNHKVIKDIKKDFESTIAVSHKVTKSETKTGFFKTLWHAILRMFAPILKR